MIPIYLYSNKIKFRLKNVKKKLYKKKEKKIILNHGNSWAKKSKVLTQKSHITNIFMPEVSFSFWFPNLATNNPNFQVIKNIMKLGFLFQGSMLPHNLNFPTLYMVRP